MGDEVEVGYDGEIKESDPAQINTLSVELVEWYVSGKLNKLNVITILK